jgi:4-hydroxybenzoate polyprenyltransferase
MKFKPKLLAVMLIACAAIASIASWLTGLNVWILMAIVVAGVLINGLVATLEDKNKEP